jgi:flagellar protein FlaG
MSSDTSSITPAVSSLATDPSRMASSRVPAASSSSAGSASSASSTSAASSVTSVSAPPPPEKSELSIDPEALRANVQEAIQRLNQQMRQNNRDLHFSLDNQVGRMVITVRSRESGEFVRQIPDEVVMNVARHIENLKGILYSKLI